MTYQLKAIAFILLGVFVIFSFALAQDADIPQEMINQYQQQLDNAENNSPDYRQEQPSTEMINVPRQQEPPVVKTTAVSSEPSPLPQTINIESAGRPSLYSYVPYILYTAAALLLIFSFARWHWWRKLFKRKKKPELPAEAEKIVCPTCGGTGKITEHRTKTAPCGHCKEKGIDICHHCSGTGRSGGGGFGVPLEDIENYPKDCPSCGGKGVPKKALPCCMCKGKRKIEYQEPYEVPCPTCKGSGWIRNW